MSDEPTLPPPPRIEIPLLPDGMSLSEAHRRSPRHELLDNSGEAAPWPPNTVSLVGGPQFLHAFFEVAAEPPLRLAARHPQDRVYEDDCVELFVGDPDEPHRYLELVVNAEGLHYAARVNNPEGNRASWSLVAGVPVPGLVVVVRGEPAGALPTSFHAWRCWMAVPWTALHGDGEAPKPGSERRGNAFRIARGTALRHEALSPTGRTSPPDFHVPVRFATWVFRQFG